MMNMYPTLAEKYAYNDGYDDGYYKGYEYSFEKAVEWLENNLQPAMVRSDFYMFNSEFIKDFKKAMEHE